MPGRYTNARTVTSFTVLESCLAALASTSMTSASSFEAAATRLRLAVLELRAWLSDVFRYAVILPTISQLISQNSIQHTRSRVCLALSRVSWAHFCNIENVEKQTSGIMSIDASCCSRHSLLLFIVFVSSEPRPLRISVFDVKTEIASRISSHLC